MEICLGLGFCFDFLNSHCEFPTEREYFSLKKEHLADNPGFYHMNFSGSSYRHLKGQNCCLHRDSQNQVTVGYGEGKRDQNAREVVCVSWIPADTAGWEKPC